MPMAGPFCRVNVVWLCLVLSPGCVLSVPWFVLLSVVVFVFAESDALEAAVTIGWVVNPKSSYIYTPMLLGRE